ncbi:hypothetical protein [Coleofasciculus sp. G2-EDA-02]|uniref:hypothetical protein n=1 Tax=unclassified Coleofasciculus TaxID=2692782 RepID=UPI0032F2658B
MMPISVVSLSGLGVNANVGLNYITNLLASGDVSSDQGVIWSKSDRASQMIVDDD